jgi:ABC-type hemin transport system ATPase subunit
VDIRTAELGVVREQIISLKAQIDMAKARDVLLQKSNLAVAELINLVYSKSTVDLAQVLNYGIRTVYPRSVEAQVVQSVVGGKPAVRVQLSDSGHEPVDPMEAHGGGLASILGFLIRVLLIVATGKRRLLVLDEPFSAVSSELQEPLSALMRSIVDDLNFQILLVTHQPTLAASADVTYMVAAPGVLVKED